MGGDPLAGLGGEGHRAAAPGDRFDLGEAQRAAVEPDGRGGFGAHQLIPRAGSTRPCSFAQAIASG